MDDPNESSFHSRSSDTPVPDEGGRETQTSGKPSRLVPPPWKVGQRLGDFQLEMLLGQGSSGYVFRALDLVTKRQCALKILTTEAVHDVRRNKLGFRRMMTIQHPSLMQVNLIHFLDGHAAMSMEEVSGDTLARTLRRYKTVEPHVAYKRLLALARHYAGALAEMHAHGLVHRDIKPQNLMVDAQERGRVIDYGLVGTFDPESDPNGFRYYLAGTPRYWSPEALGKQFYTPSGDVFSLGLVMLEALYAITGRREWERSKDDRDEDEQLISEAVDDLSDSIPNVLRNACLEMLQRKPADRPSAYQISRLGLPTAKNFMWRTGQRLYGRETELEEICDWLRTIYEGKIGRLHIHGPSGIGKTRLIDEVERHLRSLRWGQVFRAKCRVREDEPLQAFDQIADQIASRYTSTDREALEVDVVSAAMLHQAFPVLKDVVQPSMRLPPVAHKNDRLNALEAAARLSVELRKVGPLIIIIDDAQWADPDTVNLLDRLQSVTGEMLGIVTVGRDSVTDQQKAPSHIIEIKPIDGDASHALLADAAKRWTVNINRAAIQELADAAAGNPFRLGELCEEFRPGGALVDLKPSNDSSVSNIGSIDQLWKRRVARLSESARTILPLVATAGRPVSTEQLSDLTGSGEQVDVALSELAQQRLVNDEATGGECVSIVHDRVAQAIQAGLSKREHCEAHDAWAQLLIRKENQEQLAARIARHLFDAGQPGRALSYAILAAEDAERLYAKTEAAKWYVRVSKLVEGQERIQHLRAAARCYEEADQPVKAADYHYELADEVETEVEQSEYRMLAIQLLIRSGRVDPVRGDLRDLCTSLRLPAPSSASQQLLSRVTNGIRLANLRSAPSTALEPSKQKPRSQRSEQRLDMCVSLTRPLSIFDVVQAARLLQVGSKHAAQFGTRAQQLFFALGSAVYACSEAGVSRTRGESLMMNLRDSVQELNDPKINGDYWASIATSGALSMRWLEVTDAVRMGVNEYESVDNSHRFEIAHTRWLLIWSAWQLGDWQKLCAVAHEMRELAQRRNDLYSGLISTSGFGAAAFLADDREDELKSIQLQNAKLVPEDTSAQFIDLLAWISKSLHDLYAGRLTDAWTDFRCIERRIKHSPIARVQLVRVVTQSQGALIALHLARTNTDVDSTAAAMAINWLRFAERACHRLRDEGNQYASVVADLYDGLRLQICQRNEEARESLLAAQQNAKLQRLLPFQLAAEDALAHLETGAWHGLLRHRMRNSGIKHLQQFERLYTVTPAT